MTGYRELTVELDGGSVEVLAWSGDASLAPVVLLHEGLGSARLWRSFPVDVHKGTRRTVIAWSRHGYGFSEPTTRSRTVGYMHDEALVVLPSLLEHLSLDDPVLVGHSDGASIALLHAGSGHPVSAIVAIAPHVVVEDRSLVGIRAARERFDTTDLVKRMGRHHRDPVATFRGWNDIWLSEEFRAWNIEEFVEHITAPVLAIQAADDEYGTLEQISRIKARLPGRYEELVLSSGGHAPHASHPQVVLDSIVAFLEDSA